MNTVDLVIAGMMLLSLIIGFAKGFIRELSSILAWILAGVATFWDFPILRTFMRAHFDTELIADTLASVFVCIIAFTIVSFIGTICAGFIRGTVISPIDRTFGAILSAGKGAFVLGCIEIVSGIFVQRASMPDQVVQSSLMRFIYYISDGLQSAIPSGLRAFMNDFIAQKGATDENFDNSSEDSDVKELGTLAPKTVNSAPGGKYTDDQRDQLNRVIQSVEN
jgi:membrane protein required for colicin V production